MALFEPGNKAAPGGARPGAGRKPNELRLLLQRLLDAAVTEEHWRDIFLMLAHRARAGDERAAALLLDRKFGKAPQVIEIETGQDTEEAYDLSRLDPEELATFERLLAKTARDHESGKSET